MRFNAILSAVLLLTLTQLGCVGPNTSPVVSPLLIDMFDPGLAVFHTRKLVSPNTEEQAGGVKTRLYFGAERTAAWVPLIHLFCEHGPYWTNVDIEDCSGEYQSIEIHELVYEYKNGKLHREKVLWTAVLPEVPSHDHPDEEFQKIRLSQSLQNFPGQFASGKLTVRGCLIKPSGERVEFETTQSIQAKTKFAIWPYWLVLSGV